MPLTTSPLIGSDDTAVFNRADAPESRPHEQVIFCEDAQTGLQAIIGIHSTVRGPALGGTRFYPYPSQGSALTDVLRLSRGMTYKAAIADVPLGGGKAVIIGDPTQLKTDALLRAYGRFIDTLGGRYISAGDVGTNATDLDIIGQETQYVVGRTASAGGSGNSGPTTARGVYRSLLAAATAVWGTPDLSGRTVGVEGVGKVGSELIRLLLADNAHVVAADVNQKALKNLSEEYPEIKVVEDVLAESLDVYAPCALGGTLTMSSGSKLTASIVCGGANNQLWTPDVDRLLYDRGIVWVPDYVANAGGLIQVTGERDETDLQWVHDRVDGIYDTVLEILDRSQTALIPPGEATAQIVEARLTATHAG